MGVSKQGARRPVHGRQRGLSLPDAMVALALTALLLTAAVPSLRAMGTAGRAAAGARHMAGSFQALRWKSVARRKHHGLWFERSEGRWVWWEVVDGNGNGLRMAELREGVDPIVGGPHHLGSLFEHVRLGFPPGERFPRIPPASGAIRNTEDPVKFGRSDLVSFGPLGTSSNGTVYLTDGRHRLYAVVLYGRTVRVRVWRYDTRSGVWKL